VIQLNVNSNVVEQMVIVVAIQRRLIIMMVIYEIVHMTLFFMKNTVKIFVILICLMVQHVKIVVGKVNADNI
jgi:hypothetical protein